MRVFFAGGFEIMASAEEEKWLRSIGVVDRLVSYAFLGQPSKPYKEIFKSLMAQNVYDGIMCDSGAYTAYRKGIKLDVDEYCDFLEDFNPHIAIGLDEIPLHIDYTIEYFEYTARTTKDNCIHMKERGFDVIPTYHKGEHLDYLKFYVDNFPYVGISFTGAKGSPNNRAEYLDRCFEVIPDTTKVHGMGITDTKLPLMFPWYSVDSSAFVQHAIYGTIKLIVEGGYTTIAVTEKSKEKKHYKLISKEYRKEVDEYLDSIDSTFEKCRDSMKERFRVNILYYLKTLYRPKLDRKHKQTFLF